MRPIRAFLFAQGENGQWGCQVFRDFEPLVEATIAANRGRQHPVGVHVGFERPDTEAVAELLSKQEGLVFLSSGATGTMPSPIRSRQASIGVAGGSSFHAALDGFGYQVGHCDEVPSVLLQPSKKMPSSEDIGPRGWVASLAKFKPDVTQGLCAAGIWDEDSYLLREADLDLDTRHVVGLHRYEILEGEQPNAASLVEHLRSAPPWLLSAPIAMLSLSVRSNNVCAAHEIKAIGDFAKHGLKGLYKLPNLGQKSIYEIGREMVRLFRTGQPLKVREPKLEWAVRERLRDVSSESEADSDGSDADDGRHSRFGPYSSANITAGIIEAAKRLTENERIIWAYRLGFRCEPMTLQQIADQFGLTRERVRQIEVKVYKKVHGHPFWDELCRRVQEHLRGRTTPLFLNGISAIDPWFEGADKLDHLLLKVSDHIPPRRGFHILTWDDLLVISSMSQRQWIEAIDEAKAILLAISEHHLSERDALSQAASVLIGKGEDMREALLKEVSQFCIWSALPDGSRILTGFGKSAAAMVSSILQVSDTPLHIDEIQQRVRAHSTYEATNLPNIRRAASEVGMLFGGGTYGLMKHCPLKPAQMLAICAEVEDIISGGSPTKQWHSSEIYHELLNRGFSYEGKLTKYIINIALANSPNLVYLRRMIWGVRGKWNENAAARLDVKQAVVSLLEDEGKPMSTAQIRSKLIEGRGLNIHFQIWPSSPLVRLGPGIWGLQGRDVDMRQAGAMAYRLLQELSARQEGLHVSEVAALLGLNSEDDVLMLASIANKDGLRMDKGQYCYLQPWGESRRISLWEAVSATLKRHPEGMPRTELHELVERVAKRKVDRQQLSGILQNIDATFDAKSSLWKYTGRGVEEDEEEGEEGAAGAPLIA
jgi:hypothetical protein